MQCVCLSKCSHHPQWRKGCSVTCENSTRHTNSFQPMQSHTCWTLDSTISPDLGTAADMASVVDDTTTTSEKLFNRSHSAKLYAEGLNQGDPSVLGWCPSCMKGRAWCWILVNLQHNQIENDNIRNGNEPRHCLHSKPYQRVDEVRLLVVVHMVQEHSIIVTRFDTTHLLNWRNTLVRQAGYSHRANIEIWISSTCGAVPHVTQVVISVRCLTGFRGFGVFGVSVLWASLTY